MKDSKNLEITGSPQLIDWLQVQDISLALTTYQSSRLFLVGVKPDGNLSGFERLFDRAMGLYATPERLYMSSRYQLWQFDNVLAAGELDKGYDKLYVPRVAYTTGDLDIHDLVVDKHQNIIFVNTLYNCLATLSERHSFKPLWQPPFISKLVAEDRCHLNGLAMVDGEARYVTAISQSDVIDGWRERRRDGGCVIDIKTNEIIAKGLSMPHSPRWYQGKLWLLNSGEGEFGYIENGKFKPLTFCPGYMRGLAFSGYFAIVALSKAREKTFTGLALDEKLAAKDVEARCGVMIIDLKTGEIAHWLRIEGVVTEFYDVQVLAGVQRAKALGFKTDEIQHLITVENENHKQNALVSIIIPCYKQAHFLAEAVESVVSQSYPHWEIIIVNDGSPDNTNEVAQQLINKYSNKKIRLLKKENGGLADARNAAIAIANGEYIHPLDADDKLAANALRNLVALAMEQTSPCVLFGSVQRFGVVNTRFIGPDHYSLQNLLQFNMVHANSMFSKKVWQMLKGYKTEMTMYEDWEFWINCHKYNIPFIGTRNIVLHYRKHYDSITANNSANKHNFFFAKIVALHPQLFDLETVKQAKSVIKRNSQITKNTNAKPEKNSIWKVVNGMPIVGMPKDFELAPIVGASNDYSFIEDKLQKSEKQYSLSVSVIIPVYNRKQVLAKTLAAFTHQTYPKNLIEIIIADDGSSDGVKEVITKYKQYLNLNYVYQEDKGYRLSKVRNLGIKKASHEHIIILDCDMLPVPELIEEYMKYFHITDKAVLIGHRRFVCTDDISDNKILFDINNVLQLSDIKQQANNPRDRRLQIYQQTNNLKKAIFPFRYLYGGNIAFPKKVIAEVGGFDEYFQHWGGEDEEMGYRIYNAGYYFIPVIKAIGLHQEPPNGINETDREAGRKITSALLRSKSPLYRQYQQDVFYKIPKVSIYMAAYNVETYIQEAIESVLQQSYTDLELCIVNDGSTDNTLQILEHNYANNPRVRWISQKNQGIATTFNNAIKMCRGMYLGQLDSDDILLRRDAIEICVNQLDRHNIGFVYSKSKVIDKQGNFIKEAYHYLYFSREKLVSNMIVHHFRIFRKSDFARTSGYNPNLINAVDYEFFMRLSEVCNFKHINVFLYGYRWHGENTSIIYKEKQIKNHKLVINSTLKRLGLDKKWQTYFIDSTKPKKVIFQKKYRSLEDFKDKNKYAVGESLITQIPYLITEYYKENNNDIIFWLKKARRELANMYLKLDNKLFYSNLQDTNDIYQLLLNSNLNSYNLDQDENEFIENIINKDINDSKFLQHLFIFMLYLKPTQLPSNWQSGIKIPNWVNFYVKTWL